MKKKTLLWIFVIALNLVACAYLGYASFSGPRGKTWFTPGSASDGHHQIIESCKTCHVPYQKVNNQVCLDCHAKGLEKADDKHPESKFQDPRNAALIEKLDATLCITCHGEHEPARTDALGVTLPKDFCVECHKDVAETRPSHKGLPFTGCAQAGCHNYHDNQALYEDFLVRHLDEPNLKSPAVLPIKKPPQPSEKALTAVRQDGGDKVDQGLLREWSVSAHAAAGVNCSDCHTLAEGETKTWTDHPSTQVCKSCHADQFGTFVEGKHGMRQGLDLSPITSARLPMKNHSQELGCNSCHKPHAYAAKYAATESCIVCHNDAHTLAYNGSPHHLAWLNELAGHAPPGSGVSCASCHMPRQEGADGTVDHNQNRNLKPNEKMIRSVCLGCHGLEFSLQALADPEQIRNNFRTPPDHRLKTLDMVRARQ